MLLQNKLAIQLSWGSFDVSPVLLGRETFEAPCLQNVANVAS